MLTELGICVKSDIVLRMFMALHILNSHYINKGDIKLSRNSCPFEPKTGVKC